MTFYLQTYPYRRPSRRVVRRWVENDEHSLNVNVREEEDAFVLSALVPGLKSDDLNIQVLDDVLRIEGKYGLDENQYLIQELPHGSFSRSLRMPVSVNADSVEANINDGVLTLTLPKAESAKPKRISIKSR